MDKDKFIEALNSKGFINSIISHYYNIGRALPFVVQRFPDGRVSPWYANQYVKVHRVEPGGKGGKYGNAYGFYFRNGERADAYENDPEHSWCKRDDTEPQPIPCAACGSWFLLDILGEATAEPTNVYGLEDKLEFGKHKGNSLKDIIHSDYGWVKWAINNSEHFFCVIDDVVAEHQCDIKVWKPNNVLTFGKYKGKTLKYIFETDPHYLSWLIENANEFRVDMNLLRSEVNHDIKE